jgi:hypothetical protein
MASNSLAKAAKKRGRGKSSILASEVDPVGKSPRVSICAKQGVIKKPAASNALPLRRRLFGKQPDPFGMLSTGDRFHGASTCTDTVEIESGSEDCTVASEGISSAQQVLTLLVSTMAAAHEEAKTENFDITVHQDPSTCEDIPLRSRSNPCAGIAVTTNSSLRCSAQCERRKPERFRSPQRSFSSSSSSSSESSSSETDREEPPAPQLHQQASVEVPPEVTNQCFEMVSDSILGRLATWTQYCSGHAPSQEDVEKVSHEIAIEFSTQWGLMKNPRVQLRTILWNLRDVQNPDFIGSIVTGKISPKELPMITSENMASAAKQSERAVLRERHLQDSILHRSMSGIVDQGKLQAYKALVSRR